MSDLALDPSTRDLILPPRVISGPEKIAQSVGIHLRTWRGQWFLDLLHGVPYLTDVLGRRRPEMVEAILRHEILSVAGVRAITAFSITVDQSDRVARISFAAETDEGSATGTLALGFEGTRLAR